VSRCLQLRSQGSSGMRCLCLMCVSQRRRDVSIRRTTPYAGVMCLAVGGGRGGWGSVVVVVVVVVYWLASVSALIHFYFQSNLIIPSFHFHSSFT